MDSQEPREETCIFCRIFTKEEPATIIYAFEKDSFLVIVPLEPVTAGHLLVIPRVHVPNFKVDPVLSGEAMACASIYARRLGGDFNVITSSGPASTQTIQHLHIHLIPRVEGDGLMLPWTHQQTKET